nr:NeuD/PglB/VioB family sugar acetyltransferase [Prevotella sp.]
MKDLILIGGGGHCKAVIDIIESIGIYNILGVLDVADKIGEKVLSTSIIGSDNDINKYIGKAEFLITVGFITNPALRIKLFDLVKNNGGKLATIIAPTAYVSKHANIAEGTIIMHHAMVSAEASIGSNCIINTFANIEHETIIGNHCHISTGSMINGTCVVGDNIFIGSQSVLAQGVQVASGTIISAASFVHKNIINSGVYAGNPARKIR